MKSDLLKIESSENWEKAKNFIPKKGQIIIYDGIKENDSYIQSPKIKIGDGIHKVSDLPFELDLQAAHVTHDGTLTIN